MRGDIRVEIQFGKAPQPAPDAGGGTLLEQDHAGALQHQHAHRPLRQRFFRSRRRQFLHAIVAARDAVVRDGACVAPRRRSRAHRRAEIHQSLRVRAHVARRQERVGFIPQRALDRRRAGVAFDAAMPREHALHVAFENRRARAERERGDRRGGGTADAGQRGNGVDVVRKFAAVPSRRWPSPPRADDARAGSSQARSSVPARDPRSRQPARPRPETPRGSACSTGSPSPPASAAA